MANAGKLKSDIVKAFKLNGFAIRSESSNYLVEQLLPLDRDEREEWLVNITSHIQTQGLKTLNVEISHIERAIKENSNAGLEDTETVFSVINAFDIPKCKFSIEQKKYVLDNAKRNLLPGAAVRADFAIDRYMMLWQRTSRHDLFSPAIPGTANASKKFQLRKVEMLLSLPTVRDVVVLGLLAQLKENCFFIEDPTGTIQLDLTDVKYHSGFFCEGSFVLVEGNYEDKILKVAAMGFPPPETAASSRAYFGSLNTWGGKSTHLLQNSARLLDIERANTDATIVFLSDCWLDDRTVLEKLKMLLIGYNESPPVAIVLMGPFLRGESNPHLLKTKLQTLGEIINTNCLILKKETDIILVPALEDPATPAIMPRPPLPDTLCADFKRLVPRTVLASNPCRLQYCTQQIVVCRADLITKLCRNTIHFPESGQLESHLARTLICQGTLIPLSQNTLPIYWHLDSALSLYPLPDLVVIGDPSKPFETTQQGCTILNTGSFPKSKYTFKVYVPSSRTIEDSQIPDDD